MDRSGQLVPPATMYEIQLEFNAQHASYHKYEALSKLREIQGDARDHVLWQLCVVPEPTSGVAKTLPEFRVAQVQVKTNTAVPAQQHPLLQGHFSIAQPQRLKLHLKTLREQRHGRTKEKFERQKT